MKILLANKFFYLNGGSETVFFQERNFLINTGHQVVDFSMAHPDNLPSDYSDCFVPNVDYKEGNRPGIYESLFGKFNAAINLVCNKEAVNRLSSLIEIEKPDVAHLHNIYHQMTPSIINVLKKSGVKVALTLHDYKIICPVYSMINRNSICNKCEGKVFWKATANRCQEESLFKSFLLSAEGYWHKWAKSYDQIDMFLAPSQFMADIVGKYRVKPNKIRLLHNGIDVNLYDYSGEDNDYAVYFGRLSKEKGIEALLRVHHNLSNKFPLKIIGTGPLMEELKGKYRGVEFTGYKTGDELRELVRRASFVVVPSECYENCSMSVLEAMAYGKPIIGSRIGGIPEQIEDGKTGFLFEMGNVEELAEKMTLFAESAELRKEMGKAARKKLVKEYSLDDHCTKVIEIYQELLSAD